jgi:surface antigen
VLLSGDRKVVRRSLYSRTEAPRLCWGLRGLAVATACIAGFSGSGCSYQLETMFSKSDAEAEQTASLGDARHQPAAPTNAAMPSEADLAYARVVVADALARGSKDNSIPWENPHTGAGGNITPLAKAYSEGPSTCRDFLASYVRGAAQSWLQGAACRTAQGKWEVKSLRPLKQG